ncbi:MAG: hypothetical protein HYY16_08665 [Planctomycetes bacterium]|nr:hypothetical protein [Planctomycetota bacterium]
MRRHLSIFLFVTAALAHAQEAPEPALQFEIREGGHTNYFRQSPETAYHLRVTAPDNPRVIVALPAGNAGAALAFDPSFAENAGLTWKIAESPRSWQGPGGVRGAEAWLEADRGSITISGILLDNMRLLRTSAYRDYPERVAERRELARRLGLPADGWAEARVTNGESWIAFDRATLNGENRFAGRLAFDGAVRIQPQGDGTIKVTRMDGRPVRMRLQAGADYAPLTPFPIRQLLSPEAAKLYQDAQGRSDAESRRLVEAVNALRFLSYREKFLAGSHRFNTYFGRDTMITTLLAGDILTSQAREAALGSVLDRLSPTGVVAHEEDIGAQAERRRVNDVLANSRKLPANPQEAIFDYKMVDGDFILPLLARQYLMDPRLTVAEREAFLSRRSPQGASYRELLGRNFERIVIDAVPYAKALRELTARHPGVSPETRPEFRALTKHLIPFKEGTVGDWRDSVEGNGLGKYSGGVNAHLVPLGLEATAELAAVLGPGERARLEARLREAGFHGGLEDLAAAWKGARGHFEVRLSAEETRARLDRFLADAGPEAGAYHERALAKVDLSKGVAFEALALDAGGRPIPVVASDVALDLLFGNPAPAELRAALRTLRTPFPAGLDTPVGTVVANPAFSDRPGDVRMFDRRAYHGQVVWGWQESLKVLGLARQIERLGTVRTAEARELRAEAMELLERSIRARRSAGELANSELWTFDIGRRGMEAAAYRAGPSARSESNPVQLWSALAPAERLALRRLRASATEEAVGAGQFAAAYLVHGAIKAVETRDSARMKEAARQVGTLQFWAGVGTFTAASHASRWILLRLGVSGLWRSALPLAAGMAAVQLLSGRFSGEDVAAGTVSFLAAGAAVDLAARMMWGGRTGWILGVAKLAATLYGAEKLDGVRERIEGLVR